MNTINLMLQRYDLCFRQLNLITKNYCAWTINYEYISILEQKLMFYVENNENAIKTSMHNSGIHYIDIVLYNCFYYYYYITDPMRGCYNMYLKVTSDILMCCYSSNI